MANSTTAAPVRICLLRRRKGLRRKIDAGTDGVVDEGSIVDHMIDSLLSRVCCRQLLVMDFAGRVSVGLVGHKPDANASVGEQDRRVNVFAQ